MNNKLNKWYYVECNEIFTLIFLYKFENGYYEGFSVTEMYGIKKHTISPHYLDKVYKECEYLEIKGNRYTIFDELYNYLGEINL